MIQIGISLYSNVFYSQKGRSKMEPLREKNPVVEKMESDLLRNKLFELFSQREYWTVKELQQSTGQSQVSNCYTKIFFFFNS